MVRQLHPTPAVGGFPRAKALQVIGELEAHRRFYYAGFLGPVSAQLDISLFVNLRCMTLSEDTAFLISGAGITAGSDPAKEWEETANKANILLDLLRSV
jgi:isochorismate synthase